MDIRLTQTRDWMLLKRVRLAALQDTSTAFGVSYQAAANYSDQQWQDRASSTGTQFWLAFKNQQPVGMIGAAVSGANRYNLIGMWVAPDSRGSGVAAKLVDAVKSRGRDQGHECDLGVAPENARAAHFYLKQGFTFIDEWEPLESHPHIKVQTMLCPLRN
ncbi:GNAT family N-acetyltransferase [Pseudomonas protegens]|uniref:GNAT family N-acetyltransferase n=1 Tax=Pseudomonas protegens TaxID=380021 RepID=UPI00276F791C|nr:GNAT family N-acetyltransferase [Pseudomonas protegens]MDP9512504.1 GNAT family N-acetyltransferase [Pseudomonas protegens]